VKLLYLLAILMVLGIFLIFICSAKVLNELNNPELRFNRMHHIDVQPAVEPRTQMYVIGTYLGLTFFFVGGIGSIFALFQAMRRG
jgi:hypothetical protein